MDVKRCYTTMLKATWFTLWILVLNIYHRTTTRHTTVLCNFPRDSRKFPTVKLVLKSTENVRSKFSYCAGRKII